MVIGTQLLVNLERCQLCLNFATLQKSHIVGRFIEAWIKEVSELPEFMHCSNLNRNSQNGYVEPFLCKRCEQLLGAKESEFARHVFHPWIKNKQRYPGNDPWLQYWMVSVVWRCARWLEISEARKAEQCVCKTSEELEHLRLYLLGQTNHAVVFPPKLFYSAVQECDETDTGATVGPTPVFDYLLRSIDFAINTRSDGGQIDVFVKIPSFVVLHTLKVEVAYCMHTEKTVNDLCTERAHAIAKEQARQVLPSTFERRTRKRDKRAQSRTDKPPEEISDAIGRAQQHLQGLLQKGDS